MQEGNEYEERRENFDKFCGIINTTIKPAFVISSGDNMDGDERSNLYYYQENESEYIFFNQTLEKYNFNTSFWYAQPGNHERYGTGFNRSMWLKYIRDDIQYGIDIDTGFGTYRLLLLDSTQDYGMKTTYSLYGEMKKDKLDNFEGLIEFGSTGELNGTIVSAHHPTNHIQSEKSTSGKNFMDLLDESGSPVYLAGHLHYEDLYFNREVFTELHCPSFKEEYRFRICTMDNDIFSFSDVQMDQGPYLVITNPTDARFYNNKMNLEQMRTDTEIRTLILHDKSITSAYAEIDGVIIGNLTDPNGDNLWTVNYSPNQFQEGVHTLRIVVNSLEGATVEEIEFRLDGIPIKFSQNTNIVWIYFSWPLRGILLGFIIGLVILGLGRIILPKIYLNKNKEKWGDKTPSDFDGKDKSFFTKHYKKRWFQSSQLPKSVSITLTLMIIYTIAGPTYIGEFTNGNFGVMMLNKVYIANTTVYTLMSYLVPFLLMVGVLFMQDYATRGYKNKLGWFSHLPVFIYLLLVGINLFMIGIYFNPISLLINPILYIYGLGGVYLIHSTEKQQRMMKRKKKL